MVHLMMRYHYKQHIGLQYFLQIVPSRLVHPIRNPWAVLEELVCPRDEQRRLVKPVPGRHREVDAGLRLPY